MNQKASVPFSLDAENVRICDAPVIWQSTTGRRLSAELNFDASIVIKLPQRARQSDVSRLCSQIERQWQYKIETTQANWHRYWSELDQIRIWDQSISLAKQPSTINNLKLTGDRAIFSGNSDGSGYISALAELYRKEAKRLMPSRVAALWQKVGWHDLGCPSVRIKRLRSRWGSCSSANNINLNLWLMGFTQQDFDHVVLHEFCHLREMNHGPAFYQWLQTIEPDWRRQEQIFQSHVHDGWVPFR